MRECLYILLVLLSINTIDAQNYQLIDVRHNSNYLKDCRYTGNCISTKYVNNDSLYLTIFLDNKGRDLGAYRDSFRFINDTLNLILIDTNRIVISIRYDSMNNKIDTIYTINVPPMRQINGGHDFHSFQYIFTGFKEVPKAFQFYNDNLCDCPTKPIKFDIFNNDTINMINANGYKHGLWLRFFDSGAIEERKYYDNGRFVDGKTFDINGNDLHYIGEFEDGISIIHVDPPTKK